MCVYFFREEYPPGVRRGTGLRMLAVLLIVLSIVCILPVAAEEKYFEAGSVAELQNVISWANAAANASHHFTIGIRDDIGFGTADGLPAITGNVTLTTTSGADHKMYRLAKNESDNTGMLTIGSGGRLTITGNASHNLILHGNNSVITGNTNKQPLVYVDINGNFTLQNGGRLVNNSASSGGGVYLRISNFTMFGGTIENNTAEKSGGGVYAGRRVGDSGSSTFTMSDGTIQNNTATNYGGGVYVINSQFTMPGGTIAMNSGTYGGGVGVSGGQFTMSDGTIQSNTATPWGGGVYVGSSNSYSGQFTMSGGTIKTNSGTYGGGVCASLGQFTMSGGTISGNEALEYGSGVYVTGDSTSVTTGGNAEVAADNELHLSYNKYINSATDFTGSILNITGTDSVIRNGYAVVRNTTNDLPDTLAAKFALSSQHTGLFSLQWKAGSGKPTITVVGHNTTITMDANGGSGHTPVVNATYGSAELNRSVTNPTNGDQHFNGWFTATDSGVQVIGTNGLLLPSVSGYTDANKKWTNLTDTPAWCSWKIGTTDANKKWTNLTDTLTLYAHWSTAPQTHTVTVENDGRGAGSASPADAAAGTTVTLTAAPAAGYQFKEWEVIAGGVTISGRTFTMPDSDVTVKALFEINPNPPKPVYSSGDGNMEGAFRVLFDSNGGSAVAPITDLSYGDTITAPAGPTKEGSIFVGWYKDAACTNVWSFANAIDGDMTLYAKWSGGSAAQQTTAATAAATTQPTAKQTTAPQQTQSQGASATTASGVSPTLTQAPAPVLGALLGLLTAGVLLRRRLL